MWKRDFKSQYSENTGAFCDFTVYYYSFSLWQVFNFQVNGTCALFRDSTSESVYE